MTKIELLAPAKNLQVGLAAIDSGADAVYIGAPQFGARQAAGNSLEDIKALCQYAHGFEARVWVTMNTILTDEELVLAEKLAWELYEAGVDGLIIQDMGLLMCNLPPMRLHASTQCNNRSVEKVKWLEDVGFERVVLARELSLEEIQTIRKETTIELEAFVHGALCVSYSGQCYLSEASCGRSANKGACAQMCRQKCDLLDKDMQVLKHDAYLLSLHDMDRSANLKELLDAGVTSLKIEGRLKDESYVRNIVSYYRKALDRIFAEPNSPYCAASKGIVSYDFTPNPAKTFHRGGTNYFLYGRNAHMGNFHTPKSTGEKIGEVLVGGHNCRKIRVRTTQSLHNGDGLCFGNEGFLVNRTEGDWLFVNQPIDIEVGTILYRNYDKQFMAALENTKTKRRLPIEIVLKEVENGFTLQMGEVAETFVYAKEPAKQPERAEKTVKEQLGKLGDSRFVATDIDIQWSQAYFLPIGVLNDWRRTVIDKLNLILNNRLSATPILKNKGAALYPTSEYRDYRLNIMNQKASAFYESCGVEAPAMAFEKSHEAAAALMTCRYCLLHEMGQCRKTTPTHNSPQPAYLRTGGKLFRLEFDCKHCEMHLYRQSMERVAKS